MPSVVDNSVQVLDAAFSRPSGGACSNTSVSKYRERLWPAPWIFLGSALILPAVILVFAPINFIVGVILAVALYLGCCAVLVWASPVIEVTESQLAVGSARLPLVFAGDATPLTTKEATRLAVGPELDARAWLCLRGWVGTSLRINIDDPNDPVPYWLFSTRQPNDVARVIADAREELTRRGGARVKGSLRD